ncbi:MAG: lamin tail domain-containing protein [Clostridia bacterium]|nr:lamin tail domain-containing protein [Clostridia bacterium]
MPTRRSAQPATRRGGSVPSRGAPLLLVAFAAFLLFMLIVAPNAPLSTAASSTDTEGNVLPSALHITEVMASNKITLPDENGRFNDWIELTNESDVTISLEGYGLSNRADKIRFTFPRGAALSPGGRVIVFASKTSQSMLGRPYHANFGISSVGCTLYLFDGSGRIVEEIRVPTLGPDLVYAKTLGGWIISDAPTPGYDNTQEGRAAFLNDYRLLPGTLMLNEVAPSNRTSLMDEDGDYVPWLELYNNSQHAIDLYGYALSNNPSNPIKWRFPEGAVIQPGEYYVVFCSRKNRPGGGGLRPHASFNLRSEKGAVLLTDIRGRLVDMTTWEVIPTDTSWGRRESGDRDWMILNQSTPGLPNNREGAREMDRRMLAVNTSGVAITEVMSSNATTALPIGAPARKAPGKTTTSASDWVELFNFGREPVNLHGYGLSDSVSRPRKWQFPDVTIMPGQYLVVYCDGRDMVGQGGSIHTNFKISSAGETILFSDPSGRPLDKLTVPQLFPDISFGRTPGQDGLFYYDTPTPGAANFDGFLGFADAPVFVTTGGMYRRSIEVEIDVPEGTVVRYTLDSTEPNESSTVYNGPFEVSSVQIVRARSFHSGLRPSPVVTQSFMISVYHTMPVISLVTDPWNVWNDDTGMLADGPYLNRAEWATPWFAPNRRQSHEFATYGKKLHYDGHLEMFDIDGNQLLSQGMSFRVMGQFSLDMPQKSFCINGKTRYGKYFEYPLFEERPFTQYKAFVLRNGGQDGMYTRVLDGLHARLGASFPGTTVMGQAWRPVIVYLNGAYWGHYNMRERVNRHMVAQHEGWSDPDAMDLLQASGTRSTHVKWGSNADWVSLMNYLEANDLRDPAAMAYVAERIDIDNMFDYFILRMYIGDQDPGNIRFYKKHGEGEKWRWIWFDMDWGFFHSQNGGVAFMLNPRGMGSFRINNLYIRKILENPEMQDKFLRRMGELFQTVFTPENIIPLFEEMIKEIQPEMQMHHERWADEMHPKISFEVPKNPIGAYNYWLQRAERTYDVINWRPHTFWGMVQDHFGLSDAKMIEYFGPRPPTTRP